MNDQNLPGEGAVKAIADLSNARSVLHEIGSATFFVVPEGYKQIEITDAIEKAGLAPFRKRGTARLADVASFLEYVTEQRVDGHTYIYADPDKRTLTAVLNGHERDDPEHAGWGDHRAVYEAELSREFQIWMRNNKKPVEQEEFAIFIEDNIVDVVEPAADMLLKVALSLEAKTNANFSTARRLDNGQVQFQYTETIEARAAGGSIEVPREFMLGLRVFKNGDAYKVRARLKYRLGGGKLKFWYELDRPENIIEDAFKGYVETVREAGAAPVLLGTAP